MPIYFAQKIQKVLIPPFYLYNSEILAHMKTQYINYGIVLKLLLVILIRIIVISRHFPDPKYK